jgi:hypothetical protein
VVVPSAIAVALCIAATLLPAADFVFPLALFLVWQLWHFQKQNLGMVSLCASALGASSPRRLERAVLLTAGALGVLGLLCRPALLDLHLPARPAAASTVVAVGFGLTVATGVIVVARRTNRRSWPPQVASMYLLALVFFAPAFLFTTNLAAVVGMAGAHGLQYLLLLRRVDGVVPTARRRWQRRGGGSTWVLVSVAAAGGAALTLMGGLRSAVGPLKILGGVYLGLVCLHFAFDGAIWRMRDPWPRRFAAARLRFAGPALE